MQTTVYLINLVVLILGAALGALACHLRSQKALQACEQARERIDIEAKAAAKSFEEKLADRESALKTRLEELEAAKRDTEKVRGDAKSELDRLQEELKTAVAAKSKLEGESTTTDALQQQIKEKESEIVRLNSEITDAKSKLADATARVEEVERSVKAQIEEKDKALKAQLAEKEAAIKTQLEEKENALKAQLEEKQKSIDEQKTLLEQAEKKLTETFDSLSLKALNNAKDDFLKLAEAKFATTQEQQDNQIKERQKAIEDLLKPVQDCLESLEEQCSEMEKKRLSAYDAVNSQVERLMQQTGQLSNALRRPTARGSWGEITLRTVAENAGLVEGQDFEMQHSTDTEDGKLRADMVVRLPNKRSIVIDSKTPLDSYREAVNCEEGDVKQAHLANHAKLVRAHITQLGSKSYQSQYEGADYVIMFLPAESIYQAAMEFDSGLLEYAIKHRVLLANPMTLVGLLKAVAYVLDQERLNQNALAVSKIGRDLYDGIQSYAGHVSDLGKHLKKSVATYNKSVGSLERMVLSRARTLKSKGIGAGPALEEIPDVDALPAQFRSKELAPLNLGGIEDDATEVTEDTVALAEV